MTVRIKQCFNGEVVRIRSHRFSTADGFKRIISKYKFGEGWGVKAIIDEKDIERIGGTVHRDGITFELGGVTIVRLPGESK